jgi:hypothetical protein
MNNNYYENKLYELVDKIAVQLRVDLETFKSEQRLEIREISEKLAVVITQLADQKLIKQTNPQEDKNTVHKLLDFIIKIVGLLVGAMLILFGIKEKL